MLDLQFYSVFSYHLKPFKTQQDHQMWAQKTTLCDFKTITSTLKTLSAKVIKAE